VVAKIVVMTSVSLIRRSLAALLTAFALSATPALAQDDAPAAPQQQQAAKKPITPNIMKSFSGWDVRCYPVATPAPCDIWEAIGFKKSNRLAASVSVVYIPSRDEYLMQLIVPLEVDLAKGLKIVSGGFTSPMVPYHHCDRIGCFVGVAGSNAIIEALKNQSVMKLHVEFFRGKPMDIGVPLKGFQEAKAEMMTLAKQKAATPAQKTPTSTTP
jgi:invasion protein IalB